MPTSQPPRGGRASEFRNDGTNYMVAGALVSAIGAYLFTVMAGRGLGEVDFAPIAALWTLQFLGFTVLYTPIEQLIIHRLTLAGGKAEALRSARAVIVGAIGAGTLLLAGFVYATRDRFFEGDAAFAVAALVLFLTLGGYALARGFLAGRARYKSYGIMVGAEAVARVTMAVLVLVTVDTALGLAAVLALAPLVFVFFRPFAATASDQAHIGDPSGSASTFLAGLVVATAASQTILAAGPLVVGALGGGPAEISVFFFTFTLFRGPLTASYNLLARVLPWFTERLVGGSDRALRLGLVWLGTAGFALAVVGGLLGALLGPWIVDLMFGERPEAQLAALAVAGVVLGGVALVIGQALVARSATRALAAVWIGALAVALIVVFVSTGSASMRTGLGFVIGESAALAGTMAAVLAKVGETEPQPAAG